MALTHEEQRQLDQIEAALTAEEPALSSTLGNPNRERLGGPGRSGRTRLGWPAAVFLLGFTLLVAGLPIGPGVGLVVSVVGFALMVAAAVVGAPAPLRRHDNQQNPRPHDPR